MPLYACQIIASIGKTIGYLASRIQAETRLQWSLCIPLYSIMCATVSFREILRLWRLMNPAQVEGSWRKRLAKCS